MKKRKSITKFKWEKNGPDHIRCPGGFVICGYDPRKVDNFMVLPQQNDFRFVLYGGMLVQICSTARSAKEWVVETMRQIAEEYGDA